MGLSSFDNNSSTEGSLSVDRQIGSAFDTGTREQFRIELKAPTQSIDRTSYSDQTRASFELSKFLMLCLVRDLPSGFWRWELSPTLKENFLRISVASLRNYITRSELKFDPTLKLWDYDRIRQIPESTIQRIDISPEVHRMVSNDHSLRIALDAVYREALNINELRQSTFLGRVFIDEDIEIPQWKQIIVLFRVGKDVPVEAHVLWEKVEERVRHHLRELESNERDPEVRERLEEIDRNLSIEIEEIC